MNKLNLAQRSLILRALTEGNGIRPTARLAGCAINTVVKLFLQAGEAAAQLHDENVRGLKTQRLQADEVWSFVGKKNKRTSAEERANGIGDAWTWFALCADSRLIVSYLVGERSTNTALDLMFDCRERILTERVQITTDQLGVYISPVHSAFLGKADFAQAQARRGATARLSIWASGGR